VLNIFETKQKTKTHAVKLKCNGYHI